MQDGFLQFSLKLTSTLVVLALLCACTNDQTDQPPKADVVPADLVLLGGRVTTLNDEIDEVSAIAVKGHTILSLGSDSQMKAYVGETTRVIDLAGRRVIPGFIEGHGHYLSLGQSRQVLDLTTAPNWESIVAMVDSAVQKAKPGDWIIGMGWHQEKWDSLPADTVDGVPLNTLLNHVSPSNPVMLNHASGHASFVNDLALQKAGIDAATPNTDGGTIVRTKEGIATGLLREKAQLPVRMAAQKYFSLMPAEETDRLKRERVELAAQEALRHGVTSFHDAGSSFADIDFFKKLESEGNLPVRLYVMVRRETNETMAIRLPEYLMPLQGNDYLTVRSIKRQIDGALGAHGAWLLEDYEDIDNPGLVLEPVEEIEATAKLAVQHGFQVNTHAIGTRANRESLDIYERVWTELAVDGSKLRWRIEHAQHIHPDDVPRFGQLGVIAAVQGVHCSSDAPWVPSRLGVERAKTTSYLWQDLIQSGAILGNGTDVPVEPIDPIASYYASVSRVTKAGAAFYPEQAMTRLQALKSYTINNAYAAFEEDAKGSLAAGKFADIVVLSHDILALPEEEILHAKVDYTIVGGEVKYDRAAEEAGKLTP